MVERKTKFNLTDGLSNIKDFVDQTQKRRKIEMGEYYTGCEPLDRTLHRIKTIIPQIVPGATITDRAITKTEARVSAETSIRSTASFLVTIAMTMFQIGDVPVGMKKVTQATNGTQKLFNMVSEYYDGVPIRPRAPQNITSTDDTTLVWDLDEYGSNFCVMADCL